MSVEIGLPEISKELSPYDTIMLPTRGAFPGR